MHAPTLSDGQDPDPVVLRPYRLDDPGEVDAVLAMCADPEMRRWTRVPVPYERAHAEGFVASRAAGWADGSALTFAIEALDETGRPRHAGNLALRPAPPAAAEVGFALAPWARGRGVMTRALRLALRWGFDELGLQVVHWQAHVGNWPSRRVAWATGFRIEGTVRGLCDQRGERHDGWIGSVVRGDPLAPAHPWWGVPELRGRRVVLREWRADDAPRVAEACADPLTQRWLPQLPTPYTLADAQWYIGSREEQQASGEGIYWCVADPADDRCLASVAVMGVTGPEPRGEVGYWAHPDARGRGVMTEAVRLVLRHAVVPAGDGGLGLPRATLRAAASNAASKTVAERAGMTRVGTARRAERHRDGTSEDFVLYDVLAEEVLPPSGG